MTQQGCQMLRVVNERFRVQFCASTKNVIFPKGPGQLAIDFSWLTRHISDHISSSEI